MSVGSQWRQPLLSKESCSFCQILLTSWRWLMSLSGWLISLVANGRRNEKQVSTQILFQVSHLTSHTGALNLTGCVRILTGQAHRRPENATRTIFNNQTLSQLFCHDLLLFTSKSPFSLMRSFVSDCWRSKQKQNKYLRCVCMTTSSPGKLLHI